MGGFKALKHGQKRRVVLHTEGPRSHAQAQTFRKALLKLLAKHKTRVVGYKKKASKAKSKAKGKRGRRG
jgi:hypothetical protein